MLLRKICVNVEQVAAISGIMSAAAGGLLLVGFTSSKDSRGRKNLLFLPVQFKTDKQISILVNKMSNRVQKLA